MVTLNIQGIDGHQSFWCKNYNELNKFFEFIQKNKTFYYSAWHWTPELGFKMWENEEETESANFYVNKTRYDVMFDNRIIKFSNRNLGLDFVDLLKEIFPKTNITFLGLECCLITEINYY